MSMFVQHTLKEYFVAYEIPQLLPNNYIHPKEVERKNIKNLINTTSFMLVERFFYVIYLINQLKQNSS